MEVATERCCPKIAENIKEMNKLLIFFSKVAGFSFSFIIVFLTFHKNIV